MIESPGGILASTPPDERPNSEPSKRRITWSNGSWATIYSDEEPDQLRGFSGDTAWLDEFAKFQNPRETWDNLAFGMREISSDQPRRLITTTPRPLEILREIEKLPSTVVVIGSSFENVNNVHAKFYEDLKRYEGTRIGRQEINAEIVDDMPGALWTRALLEASRVTSHPEFKRVVVGVDPSGTAGSSGESSNKVGIVCVGLGINDLGYVLEDATCSLSPAGWGRRVFDLASMYKADRIVVERNFGGAMAEHVLRTIDLNASIKMVTASRGKVARAEPVAALYEKGRIKHVKPFPTLEDQLIQFLPEGYVGESSPDAADAAIWAITELMLPKRWMVDQTGAGLPITG
jgi:phage terminase large subunit-like protein